VVMLAGDNIAGPVTLVRGPATEEHLRTAAAITIRYGKAGTRASAPVVLRPVGGAARNIEVGPAAAELVEALRIAPPEGGGGGRRDE